MDNTQLQDIVRRIEKLNEDAEQIAADIREVYSQAKAQGYDTKILKKVVALRKLDQDELDEQDELIEMYRKALGM